MKKLIVLLALTFISFTSKGQIANRLFTAQAIPADTNAYNFLWIDTTAGNMNRIWTAKSHSLKILPKQIKWGVDTMVALRTTVSTKLAKSDTTGKWRGSTWNPAWNDVAGKPSFAAVSTSGLYADLSGKPDLSIYYLNSNPSGYISSVPAQSFASLTGKPTTLAGYGITDALTSSTGTPATRTITINGTSQDLSANRTWSVGDLSSSGSYDNPTWITSIAYGKLTDTPTIPSNTSQIAESGNLYYTDTRARSSISLTTTGSGAASYNSGVLNIPTPPSAKRIESYSGTTNASGNYTVTFGTAYAVAPNVQATIPNQAAVNQFIKVTSVSTTGFTVNVFQRNSVTLLAVDVLLSTTTNVNGAPVDVMVLEK